MKNQKKGELIYMKRKWLFLYTLFIFFSASISTLIIMVWQDKDMGMVGQTKVVFLVLLFGSIVLTFYTMIIGFLKMVKFYRNDKNLGGLLVFYIV